MEFDEITHIKSYYAVQGHSEVTNRKPSKPVCDLLLVINTN